MFTTLIEKALVENHPVVKKAVQQELGWRRQTTTELDQTLATLEELTATTEVKVTKELILDQLQRDLVLTEKLNAALVKYQPGIEVPWAIKTNKMFDVLQGAKQLAESKHFETILSTYRVPSEYRYYTAPNEITYIGENETSLWGNSKGTFLKATLLTACQLSAGKTGLQELNLFPTTNASWIDESAMVHVAPLPQNLDLLAIDPGFSQYSYRFSDNITSQGLAFVHSGYAFGGHRYAISGNVLEPRYPNGKTFGPEDCSSWIAKIYGTETLSTLDQLFYYRLHMRKGVINPGWETGPTAKMMKTTYDVVEIRDPQKEIHSGQLYCHRGFNADEDPTLENSSGTGGHTALLLGFESAGPESRFVTLGNNRNMPKEEGFGIQAFPYNPPSNRKIMVFSKKGVAAATGTIQREESQHSVQAREKMSSSS